MSPLSEIKECLEQIHDMIIFLYTFVRNVIDECQDIFLPICGSNNFLVILENVGPAFCNPLAIWAEQYILKGVIKFVFPQLWVASRFGGILSSNLIYSTFHIMQ